MKSSVVPLVLGVFFLCQRASAQPQLWEVYSTSNQPFVNVIVERFESDSLYMKAMDQVLALHQDSIKYLVKRNKSKFGLAFLVGAAMGGIFMHGVSHDGGLFPDMARGSSIAIGIVIGGALGGAVGLGAGADTKYHIDKLNAEGKSKLLNRLFPSVVAAE